MKEPSNHRIGELLTSAQLAQKAGDMPEAVHLLEEAFRIDPVSTRARLVSTLLAQAKGEMRTSISKAIETYRRAHLLQPREPKAVRGLVLALARGAQELTESARLREAHGLLSEAVDVQVEMSKQPVDDIVRIRLKASLELLGAKIFEAGDASLSLRASSMLARAGRVLYPENGDEPGLIWLAAIAAIDAGETGQGRRLISQIGVAVSESILEQVAHLCKLARRLIKTEELESGRRILSGVVESISFSPRWVDDLIETQLLETLGELGEATLQRGVRGQNCEETRLLLVRAVAVLNPGGAHGPSLLWLAASLALCAGDVAQAQSLALRAEQEDPRGYTLTGITKSQLEHRLSAGTRVFAKGKSDRVRRTVQRTVVAIPVKTVMVGPDFVDDRAGLETGLSVSHKGVMPHHFFALARDIAHQSVVRLGHSLPEALCIASAVVDLSSVYEFVLTIRLSLREIPELVGFLTDAAERSAHAVIIDSLLDVGSMRMLITDIDIESPPGGIDVRYSTQPVHPRVSETRCQIPDPEEYRSNASVERVPPGAALILVGSDVEIPILRPISEIFAEFGRVAFLGKERTGRAERALAQLADLGEVISAETLEELDPYRATVLDLFQHEDLESTYRTRGPLDQRVVAPHVSMLRSLGHTARSFMHVLETLEPRIVVGSLDRSVYGVLSAALSNQHGFRTINLQHGTVMPYLISDLLLFDLTMAWNDWSRELMHQDGYPGDAPIEIVGNPRWDHLSRRAVEPGSDIAELHAWKGEDYLAVVFPQPAKGPFLNRATIETVYRWVERWAVERGDVKVLVKGRPAEDDPDPPESLKRAGFFKSFASHELPIDEALGVADVAVSGYSTALLDAVAAGVPAVSADPAGVLGSLPLDVFVAAKPRVSYDEFARAMNQAVADGYVNWGDARPEVLPKFGQDYKARVMATLRQHGMLDGSATH